MKTRILLPLYLAGALAAHAQLTIPGADGSDGALVITADTTIDLSQAVLGDGTTVKWDTDNTANAGDGIYDPLKWAVVFKYSSVSVAPGATLSFTNHESRAPVVWLVSGDVTVEGTVNLNGGNLVTAPGLSEPGPGGFRGGMASYSTGPGASAGFGPGGGGRAGNAGYGGSYGTSSGNGPAPYGNPSLVPLLGGSGGGADPEFRSDRRGGGAGGGAILIASSGTVSVIGQVRANGGAGKSYGSEESGGGSGGGIRIVCNDLDGVGSVNALGGSGWQAGGRGRIRIERVGNTSNFAGMPAPSVVNLTPGSTALLWPPNDAPTVKIVSIGGVAAPDDPRAGFNSLGPDVAVAETASVQVVIETENVEQASTVQVRLTKRSGGSFSTTNATVDSVAGDVVTWIADVPVGNGYSAVQVKVVRP